MNKISRIIKLVLNDIAEFFPYFLAFYIIAVLLSLFSTSWKMFFNWPAFHTTTVVLGVLSIFGNPSKTIVREIRDKAKSPIKTIFSKILQPSIRKTNRLKYIIYWLLFRAYRLSIIVFYTIRWLLILLTSILSIIVRSLANLLIKKVKKLSRYEYEKVILVFVVLIFALYKNIDVFDFMVLSYALISFLFFIDSRITATVALTLLIFCPIFLIIKKDALAELFGIYTYYFLIITVIAQIKECYRQSKSQPAPKNNRSR